MRGQATQSCYAQSTEPPDLIMHGDRHRGAADAASSVDVVQKHSAAGASVRSVENQNHAQNVSATAATNSTPAPAAVCKRERDDHLVYDGRTCKEWMEWERQQEKEQQEQARECVVETPRKGLDSSDSCSIYSLLLTEWL